MGRGSRHYAHQHPFCPRCHSQQVIATGPPTIVKGMEKAPARCEACQYAWTSENRGIMKLAEALA